MSALFDRAFHQELMTDRDWLIATVARSKGGAALKHVPAALQADPEFVLAAVAQNGCVLKSSPVRLQSDREFVLKSIAHNPAGESKRLVVESPWSQLTSECQRC